MLNFLWFEMTVCVTSHISCFLTISNFGAWNYVPCILKQISKNQQKIKEATRNGQRKSNHCKGFDFSFIMCWSNNARISSTSDAFDWLMVYFERFALCAWRKPWQTYNKHSRMLWSKNRKVGIYSTDENLQIWINCCCIKQRNIRDRWVLLQVQISFKCLRRFMTCHVL